MAKRSFKIGSLTAKFIYQVDLEKPPLTIGFEGKAVTLHPAAPGPHTLILSTSKGILAGHISMESTEADGPRLVKFTGHMVEFNGPALHLEDVLLFAVVGQVGY